MTIKKLIFFLLKKGMTPEEIEEVLFPAYFLQVVRIDKNKVVLFFCDPEAPESPWSKIVRI